MTPNSSRPIGSQRFGAVLLASLLLVGLLPGAVLSASVTTPASATISVDTASPTASPPGSGVYTPLTGPVITETGAGDIQPDGNIVLTAPTNWEFQPASVTVTKGFTAGTACGLAVASPVMATSTTITTAVSGTATSGADRCQIAFTGIRVRPTTTALPNTDTIKISKTGTAITGLADGSAVGTLTAVVGAPVLSFDTQPSTPATGGTAFAPDQPVVKSLDQFGNPRGAGDSITLAIKSGTGTSGAALTCTTNSVATAGTSLATFVGCKIDKAGDNYKLRATVLGGTAADSAEIDVAVGEATQLAFTSQPSIGLPNSSFSTQPVVKVQDAGGNTVTSASTTVTLTKSGPAGTFSCTGSESKATTSGVATFSGCKISVVGVGFILTADEAGALATDATPAFDVVDRLAFTTQPAGAVGGVAFTTQPVVAVRAGASVTGTNNDVSSVALTLNGGPAGAVLTCTANPVTVIDGVAAFAGCKVDKVGTYTLTASSSGLFGATSSSFAVAAGAASKLGFTAQPGASVVTQVFTVQPVVAIQDAGGNTVTTGASSTATVTLAIGSNPGGGTLTCTGGLSKVAVAGIATFAGCSIDRAGTGYTLVATSSGLTSATTSAFNVTAPTAAITLTTSAPIPPGAQNPVILWGQGFTLSVQFAMPNGGGKTFQLQGTRDGLVWPTITNLTTDGSGRASLFYTPVTNLFYRVVFAGTTDLGAANSNQVRTVVRQLAILRPTNSGSTKSISRNSSITFTTTVRPARPELAVAKVSFYFYRQVSGVWQFVTKRDVFIDGAGLARTTFKFTTAGQWYVRSQANPTPYNANSVLTPVERYSVR